MKIIRDSILSRDREGAVSGLGSSEDMGNKTF